MPSELTHNFDYSQITDKQERAELMSIAGDVGKLKNIGVETMIKLGQRLRRAREIFGKQRSGTFLQWLERDPQITYSQRTAYRLIYVSERFENVKVATVARIEDGAAQALAEPATPKPAVTEAIKMADRGVPITAKVAKELIEKHTRPAVTNPPPPPEPTPDQPVTLAEEMAAETHADEQIEVEPMSAEQRCELDNAEIESFCRQLTAFFNDKMPDVPWLNGSSDRRAAAASGLKGVCNTIRQAKAELCPACSEGESSNGQECTHCRGLGYLPKLMARVVRPA